MKFIEILDKYLYTILGNSNLEGEASHPIGGYHPKSLHQARLRFISWDGANWLTEDGISRSVELAHPHGLVLLLGLGLRALETNRQLGER